MKVSWQLCSLFLCAGVIVGCSDSAIQGEEYGAPLTLAEVTPISEILASPDDYVGKTVQIEGRVLEVCESRGCWIELASDEDFQTMRIKVDDGVIVFPMTARGKLARAEGEFTRIDMSLTQTRSFLSHQAEERGEPFDSLSVHSPMTYYQVKGTGAVVTE